MDKLIEEVSLNESDDLIAACSEDHYMRDYAHQFYEWVNGELIKMSPATIRHQFVIRYLLTLMEIYLQRMQLGVVIQAPFVMRLKAVKSRREPDLQIVLNTGTTRIMPTYTDGPADICIEIISDGSEEMDRATKFREYEQGGVREYWLFDPRHYEATFYRRNDMTGLFVHMPTTEGRYTTPLLPHFVLTIPTLWQDTLPTTEETLAFVSTMLS